MTDQTTNDRRWRLPSLGLLLFCGIALVIAALLALLWLRQPTLPPIQAEDEGPVASRAIDDARAWEKTDADRQAKPQAKPEAKP